MIPEGAGIRRGRLTMVAFVALALAFMLTCVRDDEPTVATAASSVAPSTPAAASDAPRRAREKRRKVAPPTHAQRLAELDRRIDGSLALTERNDSSLGFDRAAGLMMVRAHLTGDHEDHARAEQLVERAFGIVLPDVGPYMTRAQLNLEVGRLDRVDADFERHRRQLGKGKRERADDALFAAELAFQRGRYHDALAGYREALELRETADGLARLGVYHWKTGRFDEATAALTKAIAHDPPAAPDELARMHLTLGRMDLDRGRYAEALAHYRDADGQLRGYWLVEQHTAEVLLLQGETAQAEAIHRDLVARTESPEILDTLAELHYARGDQRTAAQLVARARRGHEQHLGRFAEAAYGHALEHFLAYADDPVRTLAMAEHNHAVHATPEAKLLLARARLATGDVAGARVVVSEAIESPWSTVGFHVAAAEILRAVGDEARASEQQARAHAINPRLPTELEAPLPWEGSAFE
jgi:tetratricopeptide (TPR) repeat protein